MKEKMIKITNILWDTDGDDIDYLPSQYITKASTLFYPGENEATDDELADRVPDFLSDLFGWCVFGCNVEFV